MKGKGKKWYILGVMGVLPIILYGQVRSSVSDSIAVDRQQSLVSTRETNYRVEAFGEYSTGDKVPYGLQNHTWGVMPLDGNAYYGKAGVFHKQKLNKALSYELGADLVATSSQPNQNTFWVQQAFAGVNWKFLALRIGSKEDSRSNSWNPNLNSGDLVYSDNARPIPEIKISIPDYIAVPGTKRNLYVKGELSFGKLLDGHYLEKEVENSLHPYVKNPYTQYKALYLRVGNIEWHQNGLQLTIGAQDMALWGGTVYQLKQNALVKEDATANNLFDIVIPGSEAKHGAHWGSYDFRMDYGRDYADEVFSFYIQHPLKNAKDVKLVNLPDNLYGVEYKSLQKRLLSGFVFEYLSARQTNKENQSNYYNQRIYGQGASYYGIGFGNSLFISPRENFVNSIAFMNNKIWGIHSGIEGYVTRTLKYAGWASYIESKGSPYYAYRRLRAASATLDVTYSYPKVSGLTVSALLSYNKGRLVNLGCFAAGISVKKTGKLF